VFRVFYEFCYIFSMQKADIVILAAGLGKRMQTELPKVLNELHGKPMISHVLEAVRDSGVCDAPVIVVGQKREMVMERLGSGYRYAIQNEQLGTGHAVLAALEALLGSTKPVVVLSGDMPYITAESIRAIVAAHTDSQIAVTLATVSVPDFDAWRAGYADFGRIVRDESGQIRKIVEKKDASAEELGIKEMNSAVYAFDPAWLWPHLAQLKNTNAQGEYYLTDLVQMAVDEGASVATVSIDAKEALGVNTKEQLELLHTV
jgi:bifunctional UDP-N-acetylglucosamine pyrophosphorylase/glucosamine-1-phosphate N-acetyltransferase